MTNFTDLGLSQPLLDALTSENYVTPTPIQAQAIPQLLKGRDLLGVAQTGTGKTAAFALPILQHLAAGKRAQPRTARALILSPTRELATQIAESFRTYGKNLNLKVNVVFGGVGHGPQRDALQRGTDVLVATPGRLLDHMEQNNLYLNRTEIFVLDEADQMLDMGFIRPIRQIVAKLPAERQSLFFSATMPKEMAALASDLLTDPARVSVAPQATTAERVSQRVIFIETAKKRDLLSELLQTEAMGRTLIFTRTKHGADRVVKHLAMTGVASAAIHGNKSQNARTKALEGFKRGSMPILVATDIAARGIDIDEVTHVINYDIPNVPESYVHRIGRTARAGAAGQAIAFCDNEERAYLKDIERITRLSIPSEDRRAGRGAPVEPATLVKGGAPIVDAEEDEARGYGHGGRNGGGRGRGQRQGGGRQGGNRQGGNRQGGQQREGGERFAGDRNRQGGYDPARADRAPREERIHDGGLERKPREARDGQQQQRRQPANGQMRRGPHREQGDRPRNHEGQPREHHGRDSQHSEHRDGQPRGGHGQGGQGHGHGKPHHRGGGQGGGQSRGQAGQGGGVRNRGGKPGGRNGGGQRQRARD